MVIIHPPPPTHTRTSLTLVWAKEMKSLIDSRTRGCRNEVETIKAGALRETDRNVGDRRSRARSKTGGRARRAVTSRPGILSMKVVLTDCSACWGHGWNQSMAVQFTRAGNFLARVRRVKPTGEKHRTTCG